MLGRDLLVAPVFSATGEVEFYLPAGTWTNYFTGEAVEGGRWLRETHGFDTLPLYVRPGAVIPVGARDDRPDYDYLEGLTLEVYPGAAGRSEVTVTNPTGEAATFSIVRTVEGATVSSTDDRAYSVRLAGGDSLASAGGQAQISW